MQPATEFSLYIICTEYLLSFWHFLQNPKDRLFLLKKLNLCIVVKHGEYIRKAEASPDTSAYSGAVAELYAYNMAQAFSYGTFRICMKSLMKFQVPMGSYSQSQIHLRFCAGVQSKPGKINGCGYNTVTHFQPHHAAKHTGSPLLVQLISLFQRFCFSHNFLF